MAITPERREELRQQAKARVQELLAMPQGSTAGSPRSTYNPIQYGPRGGRYTVETTREGRFYRNYF